MACTEREGGTERERGIKNLSVLDKDRKRRRTKNISPKKRRKSESHKTLITNLSRSEPNQPTSHVSSSNERLSGNTSRIDSSSSGGHSSTKSRNVTGNGDHLDSSSDHSYSSLCSQEGLTSLSALSQSGFRRFFPELDTNKERKKKKEFKNQNNQERILGDENKESHNFVEDEHISPAISECNSLPVVQMDLNGNALQRYASQTIASSLMGICRNKISLCCDGRLESTGRFRWRYYKGTINTGTT